MIKLEKVKEEKKKDFIKEMVDIYNEITTGDLQGIVQAFCIDNREDSVGMIQSIDGILEEIYKEVNQ